MAAIDSEDRATAHRAQMDPIEPDRAKPNRVEPGHLSAADVRPSLEWSRHDRTHLEMSVDLSLDGQTASSLHWEAYYFIPETFHLNAATYPKHEIFTDIRSYIRLTVPPLSVADISETSDQLTGTIAEERADVAVDELKLFGSRVHRAIVDASIEASGTIGRTRDCDDLDGPHVAKQVQAIIAEFAASLTLATTGARANLAAIGTLAGIDETVSDAANWVDEYMSRSLERAFIRLARHEAELDLETTTATEAAVAEAQYRQIIRSGPVSAADIGSRSLERIERRAHSLKRYTSSVLWLDIHVRDANRWAEHVLHAVAAGIAMTFTVVVALLYGNPGEAGRLWLWGLLVVLAYMAKDRIKIVLQRVFDAVMADRFSDRRWSVTHPNHNQPVATVSEGAHFINRADLPDVVAKIRSDAYRDTLDELATPDAILCHHKEIQIDANAIRAIDSRYLGLTEVVRMDISRWLAHTDDAKRSVTLADPNLEQLFTSKLPRSYDVIAVYRLSGHTDVPDAWHSARFVVGRSGIRRVGTRLDGSG